MKQFITVDDVITTSGQYKDRANSPELTDEVRANIKKLVDAVNGLLTEIGWTKHITLSSGFRTSASNSGSGGAKRSGHMTGDSLDILCNKSDKQELGMLIRKIQDNKGKKGILGKYNLMMESLENTIGKNTDWIHLDTRKRSERPSMEFKP